MSYEASNVARQRAPRDQHNVTRYVGKALDDAK